MIWARLLSMISTRLNCITRNKRFHFVRFKSLCCWNWKRTDMAIFRLLNNFIWWFADGITPLTEVSEAADPNCNRSSSRWASFPFTRNFNGNLGRRVNGSRHIQNIHIDKCDLLRLFFQLDLLQLFMWCAIGGLHANITNIIVDCWWLGYLRVQVVYWKWERVYVPPSLLAIPPYIRCSSLTNEV